MRRHLKTTAFVHGRLYYAAAETLVRFSSRLGIGLLTDMLQFDETKQRLIMALGDKLMKGQASQAPSVLVSLRSMSIVSDDNSLEASLTWPGPPVPMISSTGGALFFVFNELGGHLSHRNYVRVFNLLHPKSGDILRLRPLDGCSANNRFLLMEIRNAEHVVNEYHVGIHCVIHSVNLSVSAMTKTCHDTLYNYS